MNRFIKKALLAGIAAAPFLTSCDINLGDEPAESTKEAELLLVDRQFTSGTVIPVYTALADRCADLQKILLQMNSQQDLDRACAKWKEARQYWEWSEAFLFGAASSYGIDPHIDTWPFDASAFNSHIAGFNPESESSLNSIAEVVATGQNLTGFHALEYLIFSTEESKGGLPADYNGITVKEKVYAQLVSQDLYLSACRLEAAWAGIDKISNDRRKLLEDAEMEPSDDFGQYMAEAGMPGSKYRTATAAAIAIIDGCIDIVSEVAEAKIGKPATGDDPSYIESPYAQNSIQDFHDNILSCQYALYGSLGATSAHENSIIAYAQKHCPDHATTCIDALGKALKAIDAMKKPFVIHYRDKSALDAIEAVQNLEAALSDLSEAISEVV